MSRATSEPSELEVDLGSDLGDSEEDSTTGAAPAPAPARPRATPSAAAPAAPPPPPPACEEAMEVEAAAAEEADDEEEDENAGDSAADADFVPLTAAAAAARREANVAALVAGTLAVARRPAVPRLLCVAAAAAALRRPFKSPHPDAPARSLDLQKKLSARRTFVPWGANAPFRPAVLAAPLGGGAGGAGGPPAPPPPVELPPGVEPLVLWEPPAGVGGAPVRVDDALTRWLRPHQREGVQFMFDCVAGLRGHEGRGALGWGGWGCSRVEGDSTNNCPSLFLSTPALTLPSSIQPQPPRLHPRRRHGPRQDAPGHRAHLDAPHRGPPRARRRAARAPRDYRLPDLARRQLGRRVRQVARRRAQDAAPLRGLARRGRARA
jgi:hypothetical protein